MKRALRADRIGKIFDDLYPDDLIPLDHRDPYTLLVAVLLSAQCTDARVNQVTPILFDAAATPAEMIVLGREKIQAIIRPCGLSPAKAKNIEALSVLLLERHGGEVPVDLAALENLPGVGHKTASVVMVQAFGVPAFPVDTHIFRLAGRWRLSRARNVVEVEKDLKPLWPKPLWGRRHVQFIRFGRDYCPARFHDFETCPICSWAASKTRMNTERRQWKRNRR